MPSKKRPNPLALNESGTPYGPAMQALGSGSVGDRRRKFVLAALADPYGNPTSWARASGYNDNGKTGIRVRSHHLMHNPAIEAAMHETAKTYLSVNGAALGVQNLLRIARDQKHPKNFEATSSLLN